MGRTERSSPTHSLRKIQLQMITPGGLHMTEIAASDTDELGMTEWDVVDLVQALDRENFAKGMESKHERGSWQDAYLFDWEGQQLYVKFMRNIYGYYLVSLKENF
jgi:hypothetical protein